MLKMMNPLGSVPSMPSVGEGKEDSLSREERLEQERANKEEMVRAEKERKQRYLKGREVSENIMSVVQQSYSSAKANSTVILIKCKPGTPRCTLLYMHFI